jgi:hypothetical protein
MRKAYVSFRPEVTQLENRWLPGSLLATGVEASLISDGLTPLDFLDSQNQATAVVRPKMNPAEIVVLTPQPQEPQPAGPGGFINRPQEQLGVLGQPPIGSLSALQALPRHRQSSVTVKQVPLPEHGPSGQGGACELDGNVVVNGDFETGSLSPWTVFTPPAYTAVAIGGGHLTPGHHLMTGPVGSHDLISQYLSTDIASTYSLFISVAHDGGAPQYLTVNWNGGAVLDLNSPPYGSAAYPYTRFEVDGLVPSGLDIITIEAQQDPAYYHVDDVCIVPTGP